MGTPKTLEQKVADYIAKLGSKGMVFFARPGYKSLPRTKRLEVFWHLIDTGRLVRLQEEHHVYILKEFLPLYNKKKELREMEDRLFADRLKLDLDQEVHSARVAAFKTGATSIGVSASEVLERVFEKTYNRILSKAAGRAEA
jgi:hypothetical protein